MSGASETNKRTLLGALIMEAAGSGLNLLDAKVVGLDEEVRDVLAESSEAQNSEPRLWLVVDDREKLCGVLSPFELI